MSTTAPDKPTKSQNRRKKMISYLIAAAIFYLAYCCLLYMQQTAMVFPASFAGPPATTLPEGIERLEIALPDHDAPVYAWLAPAPTASADTPAPMVVFLHGNAELIHHQEFIIRLYHEFGVSVLLPEYRGYGGVPGTPSEATIVADAASFIDQAIARSDVDAKRLVIHGRSVGGFIAAQLALRKVPKALILESTGRSLISKSRKYLVPDLLVKSPFRTDHVIPQLKCPTLIFHGENDHIFSLDHAIALSKLSDRTILKSYSCGHNDLPPADKANEYLSAIQTLLNENL